MRFCYTRAITLAVVMLLAIAVGCWAANEPQPVWPTYHYDEWHWGQNQNSKDIGDPGTIGAVWIFPRITQSANQSDTIADNVSTYFTAQPGWKAGNTVNPADGRADDAWNGSFHHAPAVAKEYDPNTGDLIKNWTVCFWKLPDNLPLGSYQIYVWVPGRYTGVDLLPKNAESVHYKIYDDRGVTEVVFDQSEGYGDWKLLSPKYFSFSTAKGDYRVEVSNLTDYSAAELATSPRTVAADAIKFLPATGMEIYSSPTSAEMYYNPRPDIAWDGMAPFVFFGTVESSLSTAADAADLGAVYCVNSVTPTTQKKKTGTSGTGWETGPMAPIFEKLAEQLGVPRWRYPAVGARDECEGPIEGGVYSSPTLAYMHDSSGSQRLACFVTGMDRQVYALDAETGKLIWKGPGVTASEGKLEDRGWDQPVGASDAFGGRFHTVSCVAAGDSSNVKTAEWDFGKAGKLDYTGAPTGFADPEETNPMGWSYSVYAWLPVRKGSEKTRIQDAVYSITYQKYNSTNGYIEDTAKIVIDQSMEQNQGRWVKLGASYFNVQSVTLTNETHVNTVVNPGGQPATVAPDYFAVAADAVMIVPDTIDAFSYSTPLLEKVISDDVLFAASSGGRVLAFNASVFNNSDPDYAPIGKVRWIYPGVRTKLTAETAADFDKDPLGEVGASLSYQQGTSGNVPARLFVACAEGQVHAISSLENTAPDLPTEYWVFPNASDTKENVVSFTSSPTIDTAGNQLFIGSTGGVFYCLDTVNKTTTASNPQSQLKWRYPGDPTSGTDPLLPLGGFRYSTPAMASVGSAAGKTKRVWCGSSDGRIYSFDANPSAADHRIWVEFDGEGNWVATHGPEWYYEPQAGAPLQGSVAIDGGFSSTGQPTMFVGDMKGTLRWYRARSGSNTPDSSSTTGTWEHKGWQTEGELFSSVNITNTKVGSSNASWLFVGGSDGRLYALSDAGGAWGGEWNGGVWPFTDRDPGEGGVDDVGPNTDVQMDIFPGDFYKASEQINPEPSSSAPYQAPTNDPNIPDDSGKWDISILGHTMKLVPDSLTWRDYVGASHTASLSGSSWTDDDIDGYLTYEAKKRRDYAFLAKERAGKSSEPLYFEWGETINVILWNLPERISGTSDNDKRSSIRFNFSNASAGDNAGSQVRLSGTVKVLKLYTVLKESTADTSATPTTYDALTYKDGKAVKRYYALAQIEIKPTSSRPPSPGPGWVLSCTVRTQPGTTPGTDAMASNQEYRLARLKAGTSGVKYEPVFVDSDGDKTPDTAKEQPIGINNPLAVRDDGDRAGGSSLSVGWPQITTGANAFTTADERYNAQAHYNGNSVAGAIAGTGETTLGAGILPTLNLNRYDRNQFGVMKRIGVAHGTNSREGQLLVLDRSATGCTITSTDTTPPATDTINRFRITGTDLRWRGGDQAIANSGGVMFPWDQGAGSVDYPHIFRRSQSFRKTFDDVDPTKDSAKLPGLLLRQKSATEWDTDYGVNKSTCPLMQPDTVFVSVNVPRFQPANGGNNDLPNASSRYDLKGYSRTTQAYVDSDGNREFGGGNVVRGRPSTYQEAYREFKVWLTVPPDPRIEVEEQLVDIGRPPHGLGEALNFTPYEFQPYNPNPAVRQWFKTLTIKNAGNVNLPQVKIAKLIQDSNGAVYDLRLLSDQVNPTAPLPGASIVSSMDGSVPGFNAEPFTSMATVGDFLGYTLSKARVGDPDPTIMTIPDKRKWDMNFARSQTEAVKTLGMVGWPVDHPLSPMVSIEVPLTQPIGTYQSYNPIFNDGSVPVFADWDPFRQSNMPDGKLEPGEPFAAPSFQLKASVREAQLTGGVTPTTLSQIDVPSDDPKDPPLPRVGDATPAAFRDANTGNVYLFWSSNRMFDPALYPNWNNDASLADFASAPWFIDRAMLEWNNGGGVPTKGWQPVRQQVGGPAQQWWHLPSARQYLPDFQWPDTTDVVPWKIGNVADTKLFRVRHHSPTLAENLTVGAGASKDRTWLAWIGVADRKNPDTSKIERDHMLFYTDATAGDVANPDRSVYSVRSDATIQEHDPAMEKRAPSLSVWDQYMWLFWQGGDKGNWSIFFSSNKDADGIHNPTNTPWSPDAKLRTPDCLASVASPNAVHRELWTDMTGEQPKYDKTRDLFDVVYSGTSKLRQNSDVLLSRYIAITESEQRANGFSTNVLPSRAAQRMPRVFNERLERDPKFGFWTGRHLAWVRLDSGQMALGKQSPVTDNWGGYNAALANADPDVPYIHVILPSGYKLIDGTDLPAGTVVSATDGSITKPDGTSVVNAMAIMPAIDEATGIYTYKYNNQPDTAAILGDTLADFSEGIIRFTKPLVEKVEKNSDGETQVLAPEVRADYTPQTWRLTTDLAGDSSPRAFIERTNMTKVANPGLLDGWKDNQGKAKPAPVDRLWVFWRKAGTGIESGTIYYRTMRVGIDLTQQALANGSPALPIKMRPDGTPTKLNVTGNLGAWEVDRTGRYIWFTETDERYRSLYTPDNNLALGANPGAITIAYTCSDGNDVTVTVRDVYWQPELPEQSLFGFAADSNVNEGSIYAFADPNPMYMQTPGTFAPLPTSKIWVFWTSTRGGTSDLFWETLSPNFSAR